MQRCTCNSAHATVHMHVESNQNLVCNHQSEGTLDGSFANPAERIDNVQNANVLENAIDNPVEEDDHNVQNASSIAISQAPQNHLNNSTTVDTASSGDKVNSATCGFKMEKPKMPKFAGDVQEYPIFRGDFKHVIEPATPRGIRSPSYALACKESPLI